MMNKEKERYLNLLEDLKKGRIQKKYPILDKYMKSHWWMLQELLCIGLANIQGRKYMRQDGKAIFWASRRYIGDFYLKRNGSRIINQEGVSRKINILCALGIFQKVFRDDLPLEMEYENGKHYDVNYLMLADINWDEVQKRAQLLSDNNITERNFTYKNVAAVFGQADANKVFQQRKQLDEYNYSHKSSNKKSDELPF